MDYDFLDKCTKQELIHFIKNSSFLRQLFSYRDVLFFRWNTKSDELNNRRSKSILELDGLDFGERDKLAKRFNASTDINEKIRISEQLKKYEIPFRKWIKESQSINGEQEKLDKLYYQMEENRKGENHVEQKEQAK